ncbi:gamma-glutamylcyclotransferase [Candidatus Woesearchaeota archaeon]|nr:gamma-glutamylcyclotransferase [Candidatus Woesearchaeota archaeon]
MDSEITPLLFVYGTFLPTEVNFKMLEGSVSNPQRARTKGILIMHDVEERKRYPFLINHPKLLETLIENTGITMHDVQGELYRITNPEILVKLDEFEGIISPRGLEERILGIPSPPLVGLYTRMKIDVLTEEGEKKEAWAYVANPSKDHSDRLVEHINTKIVIPGGDWGEYSKGRDRNSLQIDSPVGETFGMETEFSFLIKTNDDHEIPLPQLKNYRGLYHFKFRDGKEASFRTLGEVLSQTMFDSLHRNNLGQGVTPFYYEPHPQQNYRFLIPGGIAYVEGESTQPDGTDVVISRLDIIARMLQNKVESTGEIGAKPRTRIVPLPPEYIYFEVAGSPCSVEPGFATHAVIIEFMRRHHLALALEDIVGVKYDGEWLEEHRLAGNSTQYNVLVDPFIDNLRINLSRCRTRAQYSEVAQPNKLGKVLDPEGKIQEDHVTKFTHDVGYIVGKTFGPLLSYFLSGQNLEYVEFKAREGNRLEYRNTVIQTTDQLAAGIAVYVAAVKTVEQKIKEKVIYESSRRLVKPLADITEKEITEIYKEMDPEEFLSLFSVYMPDVEYIPARFRPGLRVVPKNSFHEKVYESNQGMISVMVGEKIEEIGVDRLVETLFYDEQFNKNLRNITTSSEYENCTQFAKGEKKVEAYRWKVTDRTTSVNTAEMVRQFSRLPLTSHYDSGSTYPEIVTHLLFKSGGKYTYGDDEHVITISLDPEEDKRSNILIGSIPLEINLYKKDEMNKPADSYRVRVHPGNIDRLRTTLNLLERPSGRIQVWEAFYRLK